jgi:beta-galactosidase/beta-glucuronidase
MHRGGYDAFSMDITDSVKPGAEQELIVAVFDPGSAASIARGKQANRKFADPQRFHYCPSSGLWQTVWMEAVPDTYIDALHIVPDIDHQTVSVEVNPGGTPTNVRVEITARDDRKVVGRATGTVNQPVVLRVPDPRLWSPESPFLYDLEVRLIKEGKVVDEVASYFGMRKISLGTWTNGVKRLHLNNEFVFQMGPLDQGYWPDGIYTAPTDEALRWDVEQIKAFGFNMVRKHVKVEPARWYYWCDRLGLLVWQDMPHASGGRTAAEKVQFETELQRMVQTHWNHPSIVVWVVFNEHWGLYDVRRLTENVMALDPSRLVTGNSGIDAGKPNLDYEVGHIRDNHSYRPPNCPFASDRRAIVCGEYGAIGYKIEGHIWDTDGPWVHHNYKGKEAATAEYEAFIRQLISWRNEEGLSAAVYTQWTDVENEMNGLYTYDREAIKLDKDRVTAANRSTWADGDAAP